MAAPLAHFAINADDVERARAFYAAVFGWTFDQWGPPGFFHIDTGAMDAGLRAAALQGRRELIDGARTTGFECTFAVDDVDAIARAVVEHGGRILMEKTTIDGVGDLLWFEDTEGNAVGAMRYEDASG
jgi:predicted enzyme related to lactoylglutathione lyase